MSSPFSFPSARPRRCRGRVAGLVIAALVAGVAALAPAGGASAAKFIVTKIRSASGAP